MSSAAFLLSASSSRLLLVLLCCLVLAAAPARAAAFYVPGLYPDVEQQCEPILGECNDLGYKFTSRPAAADNSFQTQKAADALIQSFGVLAPCSGYLKIFLCGAYKPSCFEEAALVVRPCRSMCLHVYERCFPLMDRFQMKWSDELNCSRFDEDAGSSTCMSDQGYSKDPPQSSHEYVAQIDRLLHRMNFDAAETEPATVGEMYEELSGPTVERPRSRLGHYSSKKAQRNQTSTTRARASSGKTTTRNPTFTTTTRTSTTPDWFDDNLVLKAPEEFVPKRQDPTPTSVAPLSSVAKASRTTSAPFIQLSKYVCYNQQLQQPLELFARIRNLSGSLLSAATSGDLDLSESFIRATYADDRCVLKCETDTWFSASEKQLTMIVLFVCSLVGLVTGLVTVLNFITEPERYRYPNLAFMFQTACLIVYALAHLVGIYMGKRALACKQMDVNQVQSFQNINGLTHPLVISKSIYVAMDSAYEDNRYCLVVSLLVYYLRMAALAWWFVLVLSWFLVIRFGVGVEQLHAKAGAYFHLAAWLLPGVKTVIVFLARDTDVSELTGMCSVGNTDSEALLKYLIVPSCCYLAIGFVMLLVGMSKLLATLVRTGRRKPSVVQQQRPRGALVTYLPRPGYQRDSVFGGVKSELTSTTAADSEVDLVRELMPLGVVGFICLLTSTTVLSCELYEYLNMKDWRRFPKYFDASVSDQRSVGHLRDDMLRFERDSAAAVFFQEGASQSAPNAAIYLVKLAMTFLNGVVIAVWSLAYKNCCRKSTGKTVEATAAAAKSESVVFRPAAVAPAVRRPPFEVKIGAQEAAMLDRRALNQHVFKMARAMNQTGSQYSSTDVSDSDATNNDMDASLSTNPVPSYSSSSGNQLVQQRQRPAYYHSHAKPTSAYMLQFSTPIDPRPAMRHMSTSGGGGGSAATTMTTMLSGSQTQPLCECKSGSSETTTTTTTAVQSSRSVLLEQHFRPQLPQDVEYVDCAGLTRDDQTTESLATQNGHHYCTPGSVASGVHCCPQTKPTNFKQQYQPHYEAAYQAL